ncbi:hypothetical protein Gotur_015758 [Gossypium turneri]
MIRLLIILFPNLKVTLWSMLSLFLTSFTHTRKVITIYIALLKAVMGLSLTSLKAADVKDIASSVTTILARSVKYIYILCRMGRL